MAPSLFVDLDLEEMILSPSVSVGELASGRSFHQRIVIVSCEENTFKHEKERWQVLIAFEMRRLLQVSKKLGE